MSVMVRTEDIFHLKNLFRSLKFLCSVLVLCIVQVIKILVLFHVIYWSNGYDICFRPKRSGFDSTIVQSVFPAVRYVAPRRRCISHSEKPAPIVTYPGWLPGIDSHKGKTKKTKKKGVSQKKKKKNDVYGARLFPSPLQGVFASFRFVLYFYCGIII